MSNKRDKVVITDKVLIYDNFLKYHEFRSVGWGLEKEKFISVKFYGKGSAWGRQGDKNPLQSVKSRTWVSEKCKDALIEDAKSLYDDPEALYRTVMLKEDDVLYNLVKNIQAIGPDIEHIIGKEGEDWSGISLVPYQWQPGDRLIWHNDSITYVGAFAYYCHKNWDENWGGQLLIEDPSSGDGIFINPIPNRLSIIKGGTRHTVTPIAQGGGRNSISGFFFKWNKDAWEKNIEFAMNKWEQD